jgi:PAS domain S-box-containing protein
MQAQVQLPEYKELRESEARFRSLAENAAEAIITIDSGDRIVYANPAAVRLFGYEPDALLRMSFTALIPERFRERHQAGMRRYLESGEKRLAWDGVELPGLNSEAREIPLEVTFGEHVTNGETFFTGVMRDISSRRDAEEERSRLLEREREARAEAQAANRAKSEFLAIMSHEIRTPINAIIGYADLLSAGISGPITDTQRDHLERIQTSSRHLTMLVNDVLDLAKVEAGRIVVEHERHLVVTTVAAALALVNQEAQERGLTIEDNCSVVTDLAYIGDDDRLRQILVNLLTNAAKFTGEGGTITVSCGISDTLPDGTVLVDDGPWTFVRVEDTGIGISPDQLERVFQPFHQVEASLTRTRGGTGLGLAISRQLARLMDGELAVESEPGVGSAFTVWLPHDRTRSAPPDELVLTATRGGGAKASGLARVGRALHAGIRPIVDAATDRMRRDPLTPGAAKLDAGDLEDHASSLLADLGQALVVLETSTEDPVELLRDGTEIQRVVADLHGAQRARLGWTEEALSREWRILWEEIEATVRRTMPPPGDDELDAGLTALRRMVEHAERVSRVGMRRALSRQEENGGSR